MQSTVFRAWTRDGVQGNATESPARKAWVCVALVLAVVLLYGNTRHFAFVTFDDGLHIVHNPAIRAGLTWEGLTWAFATMHGGNWHPVTWVSFLMEYPWYGYRAGGYHWTNVILHAVNAVLLFLLLSRMTGRLARSAVVAGLFAIHPLHVESVAWISERKDVLSVFFALLALDRYLVYAKTASPRAYALLIGFYALGLMSKAMLVTFPLLLLVLDIWPLGRCRIGGCADGNERGRVRLAGLIREKVPLLAMALLAGAVTFAVQYRWQAVVPLDALPLDVRWTNAVVSVAAYVEKMFWPRHLSIFYPYEQTFPVWKVALSAGVFCAVSLAAAAMRRSAPYLLAGWVFYLVALSPVAGIVQVGSQAMADRYTYLPLTGLYAASVWGFADLARKMRASPAWLPAVTLAAMLALFFLAWNQVQVWRDSETLFQHALSVTKHNDLAHNNLGTFLLEKGDHPGAFAQFSKALAIRPNTPKYWKNAGVALFRMGDPAAAMTHYRRAIALNAAYSDAYFHMGNLHFNQGDDRTAIDMYRKTLDLQADHVDARNGWAMALTRQGDYAGAERHLSAALTVKNDFAEGWNNLGVVLAMQNRPEEAVACFDKALRFDPFHAGARKNRDAMHRHDGRP